MLFAWCWTLAADACGFLKLTGLDVTYAYLDLANRAILIHNANRLKIGFPSAFRDTGNVLSDTASLFRFTPADDPLTHSGSFTAIFTHA